MENQHVYQQNQLVAEATSVERANFYKHTYGHVAGGVLVFVLIESLMLKSEALVSFMLSLTSGYLWLILLAGFMGITWVAQKMAYGSISKSKQYLGYFLYIVAEALIFVPMLYIALYYGGTYVIKQAAVVTGGLFVGLSAIVFLLICLRAKQIGSLAGFKAVPHPSHCWASDENGFVISSIPYPKHLELFLFALSCK